MKHLQSIAHAPHPIGSAEQTQVRDYLLGELTAMGLAPEVQEATSINESAGGPFVAATVHNIVARVKGADDWTSQFFGADAERGPLLDYFPWNSSGYLKSPAPSATLAAPSVTLLEDSTARGARTLRLRISSSRQAPAMTVFVDSEGQSLEAAVNGKSVVRRNGGSASPLGNRWGGNYYGLPKEGIGLDMKAAGVAFKQRPADLVPLPFSNSDSTFVSKSFSY